ncbi:TrmB family transcriptional regulator [Halobaculum roseum]|uniref:TrmB family transcriptional regulator n=1 Tax=Halobaculum roseum TaxID=2175149 RepID=A0ABD5MQF8_9EURY|nr:TrmB family transcriptional regulator sugar-binding domain-containing protein [Halobaculum roseum]QZY04513.1 TrmB family transcriptional regulator [Halobaculum roseum]
MSDDPSSDNRSTPTPTSDTQPIPDRSPADEGDPYNRTDEEIRSELSVFGLSSAEVDTYLAVLSRGETKASVVAEGAGVSQRAVYSIADRLERRGLVRVKDHASPTRIRALPPEEAISELSDRLESVTPSLEARFDSPEDRAPEIRIVKARATALKRLRSAIADAESEALVAVPRSAYSEVESELRSAVDRGVLVFLLIGGVTNGSPSPAEFSGSGTVVRYWDERLPVLYAVDTDAAMIGDSEMLSNGARDADAVTVSHRHLNGSVGGLFLSAYWPASTKLSVTDPDPLPGSYDWFRQAVLHAFLRDRRGVDLAATVETASGETFDGDIVEIRQALVPPSTNGYTLEMSIHLETADGVVTFGGPGSFMEDFRAESLTLRRAE